jgi:hypothetical protein
MIKTGGSSRRDLLLLDSSSSLLLLLHLTEHVLWFYDILKDSEFSKLLD